MRYFARTFQGNKRMAEEYTKNRDTELILAPGVFAFVLDETKGKINTMCGPIKTSLSTTDRLVTYDASSQRFIQATQQQAIQTSLTVPKGHYVILENPSKDGRQPEPGKLEDMPISTLKMGQIENIPGPISFPLWPGQKATKVGGHHLRSNQYLLVRIYDDEAAKANWDNSVVKEVTATTETTKQEIKKENTDNTQAKQKQNKKGFLDSTKDSLVTGQLLVIKGTEVAFYIPPTGIEVLMDEDKKYTRDAVTLERLEYSILLDEDGNKEYVRGPEVVFPLPTQQFVVSGNNKRKFKAFELQPTTGIHVKVIDDYEEVGRKYSTGEELFITGTQQSIYYPRPEHAVISYGAGDKHYATAIPAGEGRYVLDRMKGSVDLVVGPNMFLPNPRDQVMVKRMLSEKECELYYPGNVEVLEVNRAMLEQSKGRTKSGIPIVPTEANLAGGGSPDLAGYSFSDTQTVQTRSAEPKFADKMQRSQSYTPPRSITLDSKYQGAVRIEAFSGYAIQVVNSKGDRRVEVGPKAILLAYDEKLERISLSKGKPKSADNRVDTVYLKHFSNPVTDIISLKTHDLVNVDVQVKYLVRFEDDQKQKWFAIDNYVQFLVDHLRSLMANAVKNIGVQEFYQNATDILRETVLGKKDDKTGVRPLKHFNENGMTIYDLEMISVKVADPEIAKLLASSRQETLTDRIQLERQQQKLVLTQGQEDAKRKTMVEIDQTVRLTDKISVERHQREVDLQLFQINSQIKAEATRKEAAQVSATVESEIEKLRRESHREDRELESAFAEEDLDRRVKLLVEEANSTEKAMKAVQPGLIEALIASANVGILENVAPQMAALAFVNNDTLDTTLKSMLKGTGAEGVLENIKNLSHRKPVTSDK